MPSWTLVLSAGALLTIILTSCAGAAASVPDLSAAPPNATFDSQPPPESLALTDAQPTAPSPAPIAAEELRPEVSGRTEPSASEPAPDLIGKLSDASAVDHQALRDHLDQWLVDHDVEGAIIGIGFPDHSIAIAVAGSDDGSNHDLDDIFFATSVTKTVTAAIILDLASQGRLDIDAPVGELASLSEFPHAGSVTPRQLLQHTAGLLPYQEADGYSSKASIDPVQAVSLAGNNALKWAPGSKKGYSNSGYLYLGLLAEEITGQTYAELIADTLAPVGLRSSTIDDTDRPGWVGYAAGGLLSNVEDLVRWGTALYRDNRVLAPSALNEMLDVSNEYSTGLGANPVCPCGTDEDGRRWYTSIGHDGGSVTLQYSPSDQLIVAAKLTESFWTDELNQADVHALLQELRTLAMVGANVS